MTRPGRRLEIPKFTFLNVSSVWSGSYTDDDIMAYFKTAVAEGGPIRMPYKLCHEDWHMEQEYKKYAGWGKGLDTTYCMCSLWNCGYYDT